MSINCTSNATLSPSSGDVAASDAGGTIVAIICVVISSLSTTFGLFFQKIAQERGGVCGHPEDDKHEKYISFAYWFGGFSLITLVSFGLDLYSMASLGQSLVVPLLAGLEVAENQVFAPVVLHAELNAKYDYTAAVVVLFGAVLTSIWGPKGGTTASSSVASCNSTAVALTEYQEARQLFDSLFIEPLFVGYEITVFAVFLFCVGVMKVEPAWCKNYMFMVYGYVAGFLGGQQNLFLKGVGTFFTLAFGNSAEEVFSDWYFYVFLLMMLILAPTQLAIINVGLGKFSVLRFVPAYTVLYIVMGTSVGLFFYQEHKQLSETDWIMFCIGFVFIFGSLAILGFKPETVYTVKIKHDEKEHDVTWYPHLDPEDTVSTLTDRITQQLSLKRIGYALYLSGKSLQPEETVIDLVLEIQTENDKFAAEEKNVLVLTLASKDRRPELTEAQQRKARKSWKFATKSISTQLKVVHSIRGKTITHRVRASVWNMLTHHQITEIEKSMNSTTNGGTTQSESQLKNNSSLRDRSNTAKVNVSGRSVSVKKKRSTVMIAFGGGLLMSHSMSTRKLKAIRKGGEDKKGVKGYMLRKMVHTQKVIEARSKKYGPSTTDFSLVMSQVDEDMDEKTEEIGPVISIVKADDIDIELGQESAASKSSSSPLVQQYVVGDPVTLTLVKGMSGTVKAIADNNTITVELAWKLANDVRAIAYVQPCELTRV